jgi:Zn-dependent protease with chaperone function
VIPAYWHEALPAFLWQVMLHSFVLGAIFYIWALRVQLPSGRVRRQLLTILLVLPLVTAAVPGRAALEFRGQVAWFDSGRLLAIPLLIGDLRLYHLMLAVAGMTVAVSLWQEIVPALGRVSPDKVDAPAALTEFARSLPGWDHCDVCRTPEATVRMATGGRLGRPRLVVSQGAIDRLADAERRAAVRHEHAHWQTGRWLRMHALFVVRLAQLYNPVALWAFREYCLEEEIACDASAAAAGDRTNLGRVLLKVYEETDRRDVAGRSALRKRVDVLLEGGPQDDALPVATIAAVSTVMLVMLPWLV